MATVEIEATVKWQVFRDDDSKQWVGICDELKLTVFGGSFSELSEVINEALQVFFADLVATNELTKFLAEHHWTLQTPLPKNPSRARFDVPFSIETRARNDREAVLH